MKKENTTEKVTDIDYAQCAVPAEGRKGFLTMFMIMLGFTFFSASMWVGQQLAEGLDFYGFIKSLILGGMILGLYTGLLGYVGAKTGLSMDLLAKRAFGEKGSYLSSAMISFTQIGWFGVGVAMFAIRPVCQIKWNDQCDRRSRNGGWFIRIRWNCDTELCEICQRCEVRNDRNSCSVLYRKFPDVLLRSDCIYLRWRK